MNRIWMPLFFWFFLAELVCLSVAKKERIFIGVNYVKKGTNLPSPHTTVSLIKGLNISSLKLYDAAPEMLTALAGSGLSVLISAKNEEIPALASSILCAENWVKENVLAYYPSTRITTILVGNEPFSGNNGQKQRWPKLIPAMQNLHRSLSRWKLNKHIKVSTTLAMDVLDNVSFFSPSSATFRHEIVPFLRPFLHFLSYSKSSYFANIFPYLQWKENADIIPLEYAALEKYKTPIEDGRLQYNDMLSSQIDCHISAMENLGFRNVKLAVGETGWPLGENGQVTDLKIASTFNRRLVTRMLANPALGTPKRPRTFIPTYLFSLFNTRYKNLDWGLLHSNGSEMSSLHISSKVSVAELKYIDSIRPIPALPNPLMKSSGTFSHVPASAPQPNPFPKSPYPPIISRPIPPLLPSYPPPSPPLNTVPSPPYSATPPANTNHPPCLPLPPANPTIPSPPSAPSPPGSSSPSPPAVWCVAKPTVPISVMQKAMDYACGAGADCAPIQPNGPCFMPNTVVSHASFAFNSYWQKNKAVGGSCDFGGTAMLISMDPSYDGCQFGVN